METEIGVPKTEWNKIPLNKDLDTKNLNIQIINKNGLNILVGLRLMLGILMLYFLLSNIEDYDLEKIGPEIENHKYFPENVMLLLQKLLIKI